MGLGFGCCERYEAINHQHSQGEVEKKKGDKGERIRLSCCDKFKQMFIERKGKEEGVKEEEEEGLEGAKFAYVLMWKTILPWAVLHYKF